MTYKVFSYEQMKWVLSFDLKKRKDSQFVHFFSFKKQANKQTNKNVENKI